MEIKCQECGEYYKDSHIECPHCAPPPKNDKPLETKIPTTHSAPEKKCRHCAMMIPKEAKICPFCKKKMPMSAPKIIIISVIGFLLIWFMFIQPSMTPTPRTPSPVTAVPGQAKPITWEYGSSKDEMSGEVRKWATKESINTVNFDFPYRGEQHGTIMVLNNGVLFYVQKGQVICSGGSRSSNEYGSCLVRVKFDGNEGKYVDAKKSGDESTTIRFTDPEFIEELKKSKKLMIQAEVFHNGFPVFTFNISGLDPNY